MTLFLSLPSSCSSYFHLTQPRGSASILDLRPHPVCGLETFQELQASFSDLVPLGTWVYAYPLRDTLDPWLGLHLSTCLPATTCLDILARVQHHRSCMGRLHGVLAPPAARMSWPSALACPLTLCCWALLLTEVWPQLLSLPCRAIHADSTSVSFGERCSSRHIHYKRELSLR